MISQKLSIVSIQDIDKSIPEVQFAIMSSLIYSIQEKKIPTLVTSNGETAN